MLKHNFSLFGCVVRGMTCKARVEFSELKKEVVYSISRFPLGPILTRTSLFKSRSFLTTRRKADVSPKSTRRQSTMPTTPTMPTTMLMTTSSLRPLTRASRRMDWTVISRMPENLVSTPKASAKSISPENRPRLVNF